MFSYRLNVLRDYDSKNRILGIEQFTPMDQLRRTLRGEEGFHARGGFITLLRLQAFIEQREIIHHYEVVEARGIVDGRYVVDNMAILTVHEASAAVEIRMNLNLLPMREDWRTIYADVNRGPEWWT